MITAIRAYAFAALAIVTLFLASCAQQDAPAVGGAEALTGAGDTNVTNLVASGTVEVGTSLTVGTTILQSAQDTLTVTDATAFAPTGAYQPITAASEVTPTVTVADAGTVVMITNVATYTVNLADTGTAKLTAAAALGQYDTITLLSDGTNWIEVSRTDN
jgi:hypothetical protein